jgi:acetyltransferase-like isoleucine patch superfamily enzyme
VWDFEGSHRDQVVIGKYCSIAEGIRIVLGGEHPTTWVSTYPFRAALDLPGKHTDGMPFSRGDVVIGNDVWIGNDAFLRSGVHIGDGAIVGACTVVTRNVRPYEIVAGNPCRTIKMRFSEEQIAALLEIRWWDWPHEMILENVSLLSSPDIDEFIRRFGKNRVCTSDAVRD